MKKKISKLICVFVAVFIFAINIPFVFADIADESNKYINDMRTDLISLCNTYGSFTDVDNYTLFLSVLTDYSNGSNQQNHLKLWYINNACDTSSVKLYYDTDNSRYYYGTDDDTPIWAFVDVTYYYDGDTIKSGGTSGVLYDKLTKLYPRFYVDGYDKDGLLSFANSVNLVKSDGTYNYAGRQTAIYSTFSYSTTIYQMQYSFIPGIDSSVPSPEAINFEQYFDWSSVYDDVKVSISPSSNNLFLSVIQASGLTIPQEILSTYLGVKSFNIKDIITATGITGVYDSNINPSLVNVDLTVKNNGTTDFEFNVTANSKCGTGSIGNSSTSVLNVFKNDTSTVFTVSANSSKTFSLPLANVKHSLASQSMLHEFYINVWSCEDYRVISDSVHSGGGYSRGGGGGSWSEAIAPAKRSTAYHCFTQYYYWGGSWTTEYSNSSNKGIQSIIDFDDEQHHKSITSEDTKQSTITNADGTTSTQEIIDYSNKLSSVVTLLIQIRDGVYDLPTQFGGLFESLKTSINAVPDAVEIMQTAVVGAVGAVPIAVNAGFANLSADISAIKTDLGDLKLVNNDMATDLDTMKGDLGEVKTATYNINQYYTAEAETTTPTDSSSTAETETYPLIDNSNTDISNVSGYPISSFTGLITSCGDYLDYVRQGMTRVFPPVVWTLLGAGLTAVVVGRVLGR